MKRLCFLFILLVFCGISIFSDNEKHEEIDFLLFMPNSSSQFVNEEQAFVQLDNLAKFIINKKPSSGQIIIYGYAAFAPNDIEPVDLSRGRAVYVINELLKRGVSKDLFSDPVGHGSVYLWGDNSGEDDRKPNRRVRILMGGESPTAITPEIVKAEMENEIPDDVKEEALVVAIVPAAPVDTREKDSFKFPWWLLLVLPLLLLLLLLLKNKSRKTAQQAVKVKVYVPPAVSMPTPPEPVPAPKPEPKPEPVSMPTPPEPVQAPKPEPVSKPAPQPVPVPPPEPVKPVPPPEQTFKPEPAPAPKHEPEPAHEHVHKHEHEPEPKHEAAIAPAKKEVKINLDDEIRFRAYELSERRHWHGDYREQDWYDAMREITALYMLHGYTVYFEDGFWWAAGTVGN